MCRSLTSGRPRLGRKRRGEGEGDDDDEERESWIGFFARSHPLTSRSRTRERRDATKRDNPRGGTRRGRTSVSA